MTKFMKKLTGLALGLALITGVGVGVSATTDKAISSANAATGDTHDFSQTISQGLNYNASIPSISISNPGYQITQIEVTCRYNKTINPAVVMSITIGGEAFGEDENIGNNFSGTKTIVGTPAEGDIIISFENKCGDGTGKGTFYVSNVRLTEGEGGATLSTIESLDGDLTAYEGDEDWDYSELTAYGKLSNDTETVDITSYVNFTADVAPGDDVTTKDVTVTVSDKNETIDSKYFEVDGYVLAKPHEAQLTSFSATSGNIDENIAYGTAKGDGTTNPAVSSSKLRLYKPATGKSTGGILTLSSEDWAINKVILKTNRSNAFKYSINRGTLTTIESTSSGSYYFYTLDELECSSLSFYNTYGDNHDIVSIYVKYSEKEEIVPTKAVVELASGKGSYYNGTSAVSKFKTSDIIVKTKNDSDKIALAYTTGIGFTVTINGNTVDATTEVKEIAFSSFNAGNYTISVTVPGVGAGGTDVNNYNQSPAVQVSITDKQPSENTFAWESGNEPKTSFASHIDSMSIKGKPTVSYNDGTSAISNELMKLEIFAGSSATGTALFTLLDTNETQLSNKIYNRLNSDTGITIDNGLSFIGDTSTLKYYETTSFTYKLTLIKYTSNNTLTGVLTVYPITLSASDNSSQIYYTGGSYDMSATVTANYTGGSKQLSSSEVTINDGEKFTPSSAGATNVSVTLNSDPTKISTTYSVTVQNPIVPTSITIALKDSYKAGEGFDLGMDAEVIFQGSSTPEEISADDSRLTYTIVPDALTEKSAGFALAYNDPMLKSFAGKYVIATFTIGENSVNSTPELIPSIDDATIESYTPKGDSTFGMTNSILNGDIVYMTVAGRSLQFNGFSDGNTYADVTSYTDTPTKSKGIEVVLNSDSTYSFIFDELYIGWTGSKNSINLFEEINDYTKWTVSFDDNKNVKIVNVADDTRELMYNVASPRITVYSGKTPDYSGDSYNQIQLWKDIGTPSSGNEVSYIKSVIDAFRLNNEVSNPSMDLCSLESNPIPSTYWGNTKSCINYIYHNSLTTSQKNELDSTLNKYGNKTMTYGDTIQKLEATYDPVTSASPLSNLLKDGGEGTTIAIVAVVSLIGVSAVGGYFFIRKTKHE